MSRVSHLLASLIHKTSTSQFLLHFYFILVLFRFFIHLKTSCVGRFVFFLRSMNLGRGRLNPFFLEARGKLGIW